MKTLILFVAGVLSIANYTIAQSSNTITYLKQLPQETDLDKSIIRSYQMTTDYHDFDLKSNFLRKNRLAGTITYQGDSAKWNDVYLSSTTSNEDFPQGKRIDSLQDFKYKPGEQTLNTDFFSNNLPKADPLIMNLIWDALAFDVFAYACWDSLALNKEYQATDINSELKIANIGTFENRNTKTTWIGITECNNKTCAIIKYSVMNNPLHVEYGDIQMNGRSHYWGEVYVSLSDKHIEYATLTEDVLTDVKQKNQANNNIGYTIRTIILSKNK